jgi:carboxyl-terminal processing protease
MTRNDAVELMRGKPGEPVHLKVLHKGDEEPVEMTIERAIIQVDSVLGDTRGPDGTQNFYLEGYPHLAYIRVSTFGAKTVEEMRAALSQVEERGASALILDLRYNPGGLLNSAVEISDMFIDEGVVVSIKGRNHELRDQHEATRGGTHSALAMVVLVNKYSASASEIVAACLQDHGRAVVVGERSYGKGTVQNIIEVEGGRSVLKLTTADYWRPSNRNIHRHKDAKETDEWGVMPDEGFLVEMDDEQVKQAMRSRQDRDMLRNGLQAAESNPEAILLSDPQLRRAVGYLQEKLNKAGPKNAA